MDFKDLGSGFGSLIAQPNSTTNVGTSDSVAAGVKAEAMNRTAYNNQSNDYAMAQAVFPFHNAPGLNIVSHQELKSQRPKMRENNFFSSSQRVPSQGNWTSFGANSSKQREIFSVQTDRNAGKSKIKEVSNSYSPERELERILKNKS